MICPKCKGNLGKLSDKDQFCWFCGYEFTEDDLRQALNEPDDAFDSSSDDDGDYSGGVGDSIERLGEVVMIVGIIASFIIGILFLSSDEHLVVVGFLVMALGSFLSWLSTLLLRGFGQLVSDTAIIRQILQNRR